VKTALLAVLLLAGPATGQQGLYDYLRTGDLDVWLLEEGEGGRADLFLQARQELATGNAAAARAPAGELVRGQGLWAAAGWGLLAECALREDRLEEASRFLERVRQLQPMAAYWTRFCQAELQYFQGHFKEAAEELEELLRQDTAHPRANDALALLLRLEKYRDHAGELQAFTRAQLRLRQGRDASREWAELKVLADLGLLERARAEADPQAALRLYQGLFAYYP